MRRKAFLLETRENINALQCVYNVDDLDITLTDQSALENVHYRNTEPSDAIYVVDSQGYVGDQIAKENKFAKSIGKEVIIHSTFKNVAS